ncbi:PREDICTED: glutamate receptor ionotropic, delta-1, partial [Ceratosolen solmsi marchali]|uniref:Glutamate receptor ionotropic, delta-1 n=1 Tax=Ceratosolen solmsi marchali TaxID=326594 RepID=A0AAJ6YN12_9HYME
LFYWLNYATGYNDFPSLITANVTMAVIIEKGFFIDVEDYNRTLSQISVVMNEIIKKEMQISGIEFNVFGDTNVNLKQDYTILFSIASCQVTWQLLERAQKEKLVYVAITDPDCPRLPKDAGVSLSLIVPGQELPQIFLDLRTTGVLSWPKVNFIHDDTFDRSKLRICAARDTISRVVKALSVELSDKRLKLSTRALFSTKFEKDKSTMKLRIHKILSDVHVDQLGNCFMVIVTIDMVSTIMEVAKSLKMVHPGSQWLYVISDGASSEVNVTSFLEFLNEGENVAFIYNATSLNPECNMGLMCHIKEMMKALAISLENSLLTELELYDRVTEEEFEVVRLSKTDRKKEIIRSMNKELRKIRSSRVNSCSECVNWRMSSAITWGASFATSAYHQLQRPSSDLGPRNAGYQLIDVGTWIPGLGVNMTEPLFAHVSHGFRGICLPVSSFHNPPWQILKYSKTGLREFTGLTFDILNHLSVKLNFTYKVLLPTNVEASIKALNNNSSFFKNLDVAAMSVMQKVPQEVLELVRSKKVFIAALAASVIEHTRGINFTAYVAVQTYALLSARPKSLSRVFLFMAPYTSETWGCLISSLILIGSILYLMVKFSPRPSDIQDTIGFTTTWQCNWYIYGALLQQGGMHLPKADSARLIIGTWWLVVMVVVATYSGNLIAFLTFPRMDAPIDSVDDLLARSEEFTWAFPNGSSIELYLGALADDDVRYKRLLEGAQRQDPTNPSQALERVKSENYVLIDWRISLAFLMKMDLLDTGTCYFHVSAENFIRENMAMMIAHDSPYLPLINDAIKRMHESGLITKWMSDRTPIKDKCWEGLKINQEATNHKVNMGDMQGIFFVLAIGFSIAVIVINFEFFSHKRKKAAEKNFVQPFVS